MTQANLFSASQLDFERHYELQKAAFAEVFERAGVESRPGIEDYRWKYRPPAGEARVAVTLEQGRWVSACSMFPVDLSDGGRLVRGWQISDIATHPSHRGKGHFARNLRALLSSLAPEEIAFSFPNQNSLHGLLCAGFSERVVPTTWVAPILGGHSRQPVQFYELVSFPSPFAFEASRAVDIIKISHSADYLDWRYKRRPDTHYLIRGLRDGGELRRWVALRKSVIRGHRIGLIMEVEADGPVYQARCLAVAKSWAAEQGLHWLVTVSNSVQAGTMLTSGFFPIPSRLLPKRQVLVAFSPSRPQPLKWKVQLGDWDGL